MDSISLIIVDDHPVVRAGLHGMLASAPDLSVLGEAKNGAQALDLVAAVRPGVVLMDLRMPELDGVAATRQIKERFPETQVLVLTTYDTDADILRAVEAGATGYLLKDSSREELFQAVRAASRGESVLSPSVAARLVHRIRDPDEKPLSSREIEVLSLVAQGASNKEIGRQLYISEATVKTHLLHIFAKLEVSDRTAAVTTALRRGIIHLDP
jgi:DNA-binding NarL/FixJ family response regulator